MGFLEVECKDCVCVGRFEHDKYAIGNSVHGVNVQLTEKCVSSFFEENLRKMEVSIKSEKRMDFADF